MNHVLACYALSWLFGLDHLDWKCMEAGNFSMRKTYYNMYCTGHQTSYPIDAIIWNLRVIQRVRTLIWFIARERLLMNAERMCRGLVTYACYEQCGCVLESTLHVVRDCGVARNVWNYLVPHQHHPLFYSLDFMEWLHWNLTNAGMIDWEGNERHLLFSILTWFLWKQWNDFVFKRNSINSEELVSNAILWVKSCVDRIPLHSLACTTRTTRVGIGGVFRDSKG